MCQRAQVGLNGCFEQGTAERLTLHLVEEHSVVDPTYIEDFLLTYRTFLSSPMVVGKKLLEWFHDPSLRDKVCGARLRPRPSPGSRIRVLGWGVFPPPAQTPAERRPLI